MTGRPTSFFRRSCSPGLWLLLSILAAGTAGRAEPIPPSPPAAPHPVSLPDNIYCQGIYDYHLQGVHRDETSIYWSFTTEVVKTDLAGEIVSRTLIPQHAGDLTVHDGIVYVVVNKGAFNGTAPAENYVYLLDAADMSCQTYYVLASPVYGAGAIGTDGKVLWISGGLPENETENFIYEYDFNLNLKKVLRPRTGHTSQGIQTLTYDSASGWWIAGVYASCPLLISKHGTYGGPMSAGVCAYGLAGWPESAFARAFVEPDGKRWRGYLRPFVPGRAFPPTPVPSSSPLPPAERTPPPQASPSPADTAVPATPARDEASPAPTMTPWAGPTPGQDTFIDHAYRSTYGFLSGNVQHFDSFFGDPNTLEMENTREPWVRMRVGTQVKEYEGAKFTNSFASSIPLPIMEHYVHAFLSNDPDDTETDSSENLLNSESATNNRLSAGIHYYVVDRSRFKNNLSSGVKLQWPPQPYLKPRAMYSFALEPVYCRATQYVYWYVGDGFGEKSNFQANLSLGKRWLLQSESSGTFDYDSNGVDLSQGLTLMYLDYSAIHGENYAASIEGNVYAHTWTACELTEYNVIVRYYHKIWRDWLRIGLAAGLNWERETEDNEPDYWHRCAPMGAIFIEILLDSSDDLARARSERYQ